MKTLCILRTKLTTNIIVACIILQCATAQRGPCIDGGCVLESDDCYEDQCYEVVGDCNENNECEHEDSKCVDSEKKANICIWLKTPKVDDDVTVPLTTIPSAMSPTITLTPEICQDKAASGKPSDCLLHSHLCHDPIYAELMKDQCTKTCGFCDSEISTMSTSSVCEDKKGIDGQSNCKDVKYLCNVPLYIPLISIQCPLTCGLC
ncbi:unnamed protein product [Brugia pahangi]|uniref:ShKT domain-containing protein n=1 Tax=Brugia pahangi TaxID=6280 RepID=A0A0N4TXH6_BRUPA|nr:unnamed protein product [Brugia pahangi]